MASYSFIGSGGSSAGWGGSGLGTWGMLGPAIYNSTAAGLKLENALYDTQNRVALDPYTVPAAAQTANAQRERALRDAMVDAAAIDKISSLAGDQKDLVGNRALTTAPSPATVQTGDPSNAQWLLNNLAANAIAPSPNFLQQPAQGTLGAELFDPTYSWLFRGM